MIEQEKIRDQAKKIMDEFIHELNKAEDISDFGEIRGKNVREKLKQKDGNEFRKKMFDNAPKKNENYILAEKKKW